MTDSKELTPQESFQSQIADRLREDVGKLIPDEVLAEMVEKAIQEMFFTRREDDSNYQKKIFPSWFEDEVASQLKSYIQSNLIDYFAAEGDKINAAILESVKESVPELITQMITSGVSGIGYSVGMNLGMQLNDAINANFSR